ncbi:hypothetical protein Tco_1199100, partial [Tanacetum coccineum]
MDDELVAPENHLKIGKCNLRLSFNLKSKEPTLQVALDALKFTLFYNAFEITADVPEIYMQEFWVTVFRHHSSLRFKLNGKSHTINVDNFRDMVKICPKLPGQEFEEPPLEEEILSFIRDLGHTCEIKFLSDANVNHMHQPWRSFAAIINKCLSGKTIALESLRLSRVQILWGMYHTKTIDYVYLLWEDLVYQVEKRILRRTMTYIIHDSPKSLSTTSWQRTRQYQGETRCFSTMPGMTSCSPYSHSSGSGDGVDIHSKVPDEQQQTISGTNEGASDKPKVLDVPEYISESEEESC